MTTWERAHPRFSLKFRHNGKSAKSNLRLHRFCHTARIYQTQTAVPDFPGPTVLGHGLSVCKALASQILFVELISVSTDQGPFAGREFGYAALTQVEQNVSDLGHLLFVPELPLDHAVGIDVAPAVVLDTFGNGLAVLTLVFGSPEVRAGISRVLLLPLLDGVFGTLDAEAAPRIPVAAGT